jgi:anti-anti-sigma factor
VKVQFEKIGLTTLMIPEGRLDFSSAPGFEKQLNEVLAGAGTVPAAVIIDCAALDYVSSAGLRAFLLAARTAQRAGISFGLCSLKPTVREVFDLSGFSRIIAVHADRATALTHDGAERCCAAAGADPISAGVLVKRTVTACAGLPFRACARGSIHKRRQARLAGRSLPAGGGVAGSGPGHPHDDDRG